MSDVDFILNQSLVVNSNAAIGGSIVQGPTTQSIVSNTTITTDTVIDSSDINLIQSASYLIQVVSESGYEITEVMLVHDNEVSYLAEYGQLTTTEYPLAMFTTTIVNNEMRLIGTAVDSSAKIWFQKTEIESITIL